MYRLEQLTAEYISLYHCDESYHYLHGEVMPD